MLLLLLLTPATTFAGSATWQTSPSSGDWNSATNWTPSTVPNGPSDTATFGSSNTTSVSLSSGVEINGIVFNAGASAFTITVPINSSAFISGAGIMNSAVTQNFVTGPDTTQAGNGGRIVLTNSATAGSGTVFTNNGGTVSFAGGGTTLFSLTSTAGSGTFVNNGGTASGAQGGSTRFSHSSGAGDATLTANGGLDGGFGGTILFVGKSHGDLARVELFGDGKLEISFHDAPGLTVGSIEGSGAVFLGSNNLTVGSGNLSTTFSGMIQDGGFGGGSGGSLTKNGKGALVLTHANTYTGGTIVNAAKFVVNNQTGSGTGSGPVQVSAGRLGGRGTIAGDVTVGDRSGRGAALSPGNNAITRGTLTVQSTLTFNSDAAYHFGLNSRTARADRVVAKGVTINSGAQFSFADLGGGTLTAGTVFTVISNTSATPIAGSFSNLSDGSTFSGNGNNFKVNYQGGDGNDLTLTVQ